ncbi:hypothetical protein HAX54_053145 [Datura stramonium]|uniref:Uncharacterized protein n=1 Tax=Datura stramonium TaxID=4076 RepID=A0ABS8T0X2_DATST|nr:hypothetical protein [Datura stramonium]
MGSRGGNGSHLRKYDYRMGKRNRDRKMAAIIELLEMLIRKVMETKVWSVNSIGIIEKPEHIKDELYFLDDNGEVIVKTYDKTRIVEGVITLATKRDKDALVSKHPKVTSRTSAPLPTVLSYESSISHTVDKNVSPPKNGLIKVVQMAFAHKALLVRLAKATPPII